MDREEVIKWLKIMKANLNTFPENNCGKKIEALAEAIRLLKNEQSENPTGSTPKNDLGVDCIDRDSAIKALDYDIKCFEFKSGVSKHMDDIAKLLNTIYETQVNNIKALPSVTPQEPRWIPCSEKLPEKNIEVLITTEWDCITIGEMFSNNDWFIHEGATTTNIDDIKAWMPLPKPYREVEE